MKITIIGCGYVGKALALTWKRAGHHITVTTRTQERVDELSQVANEVVVLGEDPSHFFSKTLQLQEVIVISVAADSAKDYEKTYLQTVRELADATPKLPFLQQIIYTGSTSIYGDHKGSWVNEETIPSPENRNAQILLETEQVLEKLTMPQRKVCIFRLGEIFGPGRDFASRLKRIQGQPLPGTGGNYTNIIHLHDILRAIDFALQNQLSGIYNLCNDIHMLRQELYSSICESVDLPKVVWDPAIRSIHGGNKRVSNDKLKAAGFRFAKNSFIE
jgi:nucleoside-diphosphate-sugar epimerase